MLKAHRSTLQMPARITVDATGPVDVASAAQAHHRHGAPSCAWC